MAMPSSRGGRRSGSTTIVRRALSDAFGRGAGSGPCPACRARSGYALPASARYARCRCRRPVPTRCWCAPATPASAAAPRRWSSAAGCRRASTPLMRAPFQEGEFPARSSTATSASAWSRRGPAALRRPHRVLPLPAPDRYVVPASAVTPVPDGVPAARAVLAGTVETAVNALWDAAPLVGDRIAVVGAGHGRLLRRPRCSPASRASGCSWSTPTRPGPRSPRRSACGFALARGRRRRAATSSCTPAPPRRASHARLDCSAPRATVIELSWYGDRTVRRCRSARRSTPGGSTVRASQVGAVSPGDAAPQLRRPAGARARPARRSGVRRADHRRRARSTDLPDVLAELADGPPLGAVPARRLRPRWSDRVQRDGPRPRHDRPQLPRRGLRARAAPARRDVRGRRDVPPRRAGRRQHRRRHRPGHRRARRRRSAS